MIKDDKNICTGVTMHEDMETCNNTSVGVIVWSMSRLTHLDLLLLERRKFPVGFACPSGHVEPGESFEDAARREVREETGLCVESPLHLVAEGNRWNRCRRPGGSWHHWKVYEVIVNPELRATLSWNADEAKQANWCDYSQTHHFARLTEQYLSQRLSDDVWQAAPGLEVVWYHFLKDLGVLQCSDTWNLWQHVL